MIDLLGRLNLIESNFIQLNIKPSLYRIINRQVNRLTCKAIPGLITR